MVDAGQDILAQDIIAGNAHYAADAGSSDTYVISLPAAPSSYTDGLTVRFKANTLNTGASTLNVNSLGAIAIKRPDGTDTRTGDIIAGQLVEVVYRSSAFYMISPLASTNKIAIDTTEVTFADGNGGGGAGVEQTLFSKTIPGGILSTNNAIRFKIYLRDVNIDTAAGALVFKVKYGGTTQLTVTMPAGNNDATDLRGWFEGYILGDGSTSVQKMTATVDLFGATDAETASDASVSVSKHFGQANAAGAIDSTTDQTLAITGTMLNNAGNDMVVEWCIIEAIK